MSRSAAARHSRPSGRGALEAAYGSLRSEVSALRTDRYADHLELIRLTALVNGLSSIVARMSQELAEVRRELQALRHEPVQRDPAIEMLAAQAADLRATLAAQQEHVIALTSRIGELIAEVGRRPATPVLLAPQPLVAAAPEPEPVPVPPEPDYAGIATPRPAPLQSPPPRATPSPLATLAARPSVPLRPQASLPYPVADSAPEQDPALDDETVARLRLIREGFDR